MAQHGAKDIWEAVAMLLLGFLIVLVVYHSAILMHKNCRNRRRPPLLASGDTIDV